MKHRYFDGNGNEVDAVHALDGNGILRNGFTLRIPMLMRDTAPWRETDPRGRSSEVTGQGERGQGGSQIGSPCTRDGWPGVLRRGSDGELFCNIGRKVDGMLITDGRTDDKMSLNRPGFRVPIVHDRRAVRDAYQRYETGLVNAYRVNDGEVQCPDCNGCGRDENIVACETCGGDGTVPADYKRTAGANFGGTQTAHEGLPPPRRADSAMLQSHRIRMAKLHDAYDEELRNAWRAR